MVAFVWYVGSLTVKVGTARGKEPIERGAAGPRRCSNACLKILLLVCFVALATFLVSAYPLLRTDLVEVVLPEQSVEYWHRDALSFDYVPKNSEAKRAALNETFLAFAAIDPSIEQDARRAKALLEDRRVDPRAQQSRLHHQSRMDHYVDFSRSRREPQYESWLLQLNSRRYGASWPKFRRLLQTWIQKKRHEPRVMEELLSTIKKPVDDFYSSSNQTVAEGKRYKTCAVVGNSGILLNKSLGSFIDSHDAVIRLNNARVRDFEDSVGTKVTLSFINSNVYNTCGRRLKCFCHPYGPVPIVLYICQVQHLMDIVYCEENGGAPVLVTDPRFDVLCARIVKWYSVKQYVAVTGNSIRSWEQYHNSNDFHYSSGFQAVMLALGICEKVDLLGFGKSPDAKHHYHTNQRSELELHDYEAEYLFYDDLVLNRISTIPFLRDAGIEIPPVQVYR